MTFGPKLTAKMKRALQAEIKAFNRAKIKREIEINAVGMSDNPAYQTWLGCQPDFRNATRKIHEPDNANPDQLSEERAFKWGKSTNLTPEEEIKRAQIQRLLTPKQWAVWKLCMQQALTQQEAARQLNISQPTLAIHLKRSLEIVTQYLTEGSK